MTTTKYPSLRLTTYHRDAIINLALDDAFGEKLKELRRRENAIADRVYDANVSEREREALAALGPRWIHTQSRTAVAASNGDQMHMTFSTERAVPTSGPRFTTRPGTELDADFRQFLSDLAKHYEDRDAARGKLRVLLESVSTLARLTDLWPEGEPYYRHLAGKEPSRALVVPVADVNAALGLPKPEPKAS